MAGFDSKNALNHAIKYLAETAQGRAAGGWVSSKERERQRKDSEKQEKEHQKLLSKEYPTHYMPNVGRQVMAQGGMLERTKMSSTGRPWDQNNMGLYSKASHVAEVLPQKKATGAQMIAALRDPKRGIKKEELIHAGLLTPEGEVHPDWANKTVTTQDMLTHLARAIPQIDESVYDEKAGDEDPDKGPRYSEYVLPNSDNYREVLLRLNTDIPASLKRMELEKKYGPNWRYEAPDSENKDFQKVQNPFFSSHWEDPNVLAHIRMSDRKGPNGEKILHVEELQSDWGQRGREEGFGVPPEEEELFKKTDKRMREIRSREAQIIEDELQGKPVDKRELQQLYMERQKLVPIHSALELKRDTAIPHGPYVTSTEGWTDLALKRVLKEAAEGGYDKIIWTPGEEQAKRYRLSSHVDRLAYDPEEKTLSYWKKGANAWTDHPGNVEPEKLPSIIGKEAAKQLLESEPNKLSGIHSLEAQDLVIGDKGMKGYYDKIVPSRLQALAKKHDPNAKISTSLIKTHGEEWPFSARIAHDGEKYWVSGQSPRVDHANDVQLSPKFGSYEEADNHRNLLYSGYNQPVHSMDVTPQMRESIMKGQEAFARGGSVGPNADMIRQALESVANPTSVNPELAAKAGEIASQAYKVPTENVTAGPSYYGFKGPMNVSDITTNIENIPGVEPLPKKEMSWEDFYKIGKGGTMINLGGDRSRLGRLTHINGKQLAWPVDLHAGPEYMLEPNPGAVWANAAGHTSGLRKKIQQAAENGPVYGVYTPMGPKTVDSSFQMFDALLSQIAADPPSKKVAKQLDDALRQGKFVMGSTDKAQKDRAKEVERMASWPGILNAAESREHAKTLPGSTRSLIVKYLDKAAWHKLGLPHIGVTRAAITNPDLLGAPANMMGHRIVELNPNDISESRFKHNTYASPTGGKYVGDVPLVQRHYAMPDVIDQFLARRVGKNEDVIMHPYSLQSGGRDAARKMLEEQKQMQPVSQRMLDSIQEGLQRQKHYGLKDGGVADREHFSVGGEGPEAGSTGSAAGNSYGGNDTSDSGGGIGSDYGADRSGADYGGGGYGYGQDNFGSGGNDSGWMGGGGRDSNNVGNEYLSNMMSQSDRFGGSEIMSPFVGTPMGIPARSQQQMLDTLGIEGKPENTGLPSNLHPGGNIGSDFLKNAISGRDSSPQTGTVGAPTIGAPEPMTGEQVRQGDVPGMAQENLDWNKALTAMQRQNQSIGIADKTNSATNAFMGAIKDLPAKLEEAQPLYAASKIPLVGGMIANHYGLEELTPTQSAALYAKIYAEPKTLADNLDWSFGQRAGSVGSMPSNATEYNSDLSAAGSYQPAHPSTPTPSTATPQPSNENFGSAFAAARSRGDATFTWTNPVTGKTGLYTTQLARKEGGRVPSMNTPDDWLADNEADDKEQKPKAKKAKSAGQRDNSAIVSRAVMLSLKKS